MHTLESIYQKIFKKIFSSENNLDMSFNWFRVVFEKKYSRADAIGTALVSV